MTGRSNSEIPLFGPPRKRPVFAAAAAVVLSLALHVLAVRSFPEFSMGQPRGLDEHVRARALVLGDVRRTPPERVERPERFQAQDPTVSDSFASLETSAFRELLESLVLPDLPDLGVTFSGEASALAEPDRGVERDRWDPRQDMVQIRERIVPDELSARPRRYVPEVPRVPVASDIIFPVDSPEELLQRRGAAVERSWRIQEGVSMLPPGGVAMDDPSNGTRLDPDDRSDAPDPLDDLDVDSADVEAIESLLTLRLTAYSDEAHIYFRIDIEPVSLDALPVLAKDVVLIQDASQSMTQPVLNRAMEGMRHWLQRLHDGDRFDIMRFNVAAERAFGELTPISPASRARANLFIESIRARGGTDVYESLKPLIEMDIEPGRPVIAVLIGDGVSTYGVVNSSDIIEQFTVANDGRVSFFSVGAGPSINRYLLDFISYKNRGDSRIVQDPSMLPDALDRLAQELSRPVLTDLRLRVAGRDGVEFYPRALTHLYVDRPLSMYGRAPLAESVDDLVIQVMGRSGTDIKDMVFNLELDGAGQGATEVRTGWAWQKVYHLVGEHIRTRNPEIMQEIQRMSTRYGLQIQYGSEHVPRRF